MDGMKDAIRSDSLSIDRDRAALMGAIEQGDRPSAEAWLRSATLEDAVYVVAGLPEQQRAALLALLPAEDAADLLRHLPESQALEILEDLDRPVAADILGELPSNERAGFVKALDSDEAGEILAQCDRPVAADIRRLARYDEGTIGSLMVSEFLAYDESATVRDLLADLQNKSEAYAGYNIQYFYVTSGDASLRGVLPVRRLLLARRDASLRDTMIADPIAVRAGTPIEEARRVFNEHGFIGLPVIDGDGRLVGVVERGDIDYAEVEEAEDVYRQAQGIVGGEELRTMPLLKRSRRRLAWLSANIVLNIIAASMIALHQDTLEAVIAIAVFLPIISDMSGCSGNQAVAVSMRELTLGVTRPRDAMRVLFKEVSLGLINGVILGILIGTVALLWKGNLYLGLVVGSALAMNTIIAVAIGGLVPLLLKRLKTDPALASGPILTTITDMCGFFIVLTLASQMLSKLATG